MKGFSSAFRVFIVYALVLVVCNTVFVVFAGAKPAKWTNKVEDKECLRNAFQSLQFLYAM